MLFNVSGLIQEGIGATRRHEVEGPLKTEGRPSEPLAGTVELVRTKDGVLVRAQLSLAEQEACSRCLRPLQETLQIAFEEEFQTTVDLQTGEAEDVDEEAFLIDQNHILDMTEAIRQYREAAVVMQPLCRAQCKGLCAKCGQDLNVAACYCDVAPVDERWAALAGLLGRTEGKE